jgi:acetyl-CoA carboxylase biotin carboxyl carrier protein
MDINDLKRILGLFDRSTATELKIEEDGLKLTMSKHNKSKDYASQPQMMAMPQFYQQPIQANTPAPQVVSEQTPTVTVTPEAAPKDDGLFQIKSPIVGTFYRAPSPESDPFVEVGTHVSKGQTLCIVEAMKLMNEIESDVSGTVQKILIENAQPVEFDQVIFLVKPD